MFDTADIHAHGAEDLYVAHGIEVKAVGEFIDDELLDHFFGVFGGGSAEKEKLAIDIRHLFARWDDGVEAIVDAVCILDDKALFGLSEDRFETNHGECLRCDEIF